MIAHATDLRPGRDGAVRIAFDLSGEQLAAVAHAASEARRERYRDQAMGVDDVLAMRGLTALCDRLAECAAAGLATTLALTVAELTALHDALTEWTEARELQGWMREDDRAAHRLVSPLLWDLGDLRARALAAVLADNGSVACRA